MRQIAIAIVLVLTAGVLGFALNLVYRGELRAPRVTNVPLTATTASDTTAITAPKPASESGSESEPAMAGAGAASGRIPKVLPVFSLRDSDGQVRSLEYWKGKSLAINFWATWCPPCRREIPLLKKLNAERAAQNFQVIGIAVDFRDAVLAYAKKARIDYPLLIGEQDGLEAADAFGAGTTGFPFTVFSDNQGRIVTLFVGELHADHAAKIFDTIAALNAGRLNLQQAQDALASKG